MKRFLPQFYRDQSGSIAALTGIVLFVILAFVALAVDISHIVTVRGELQRAADSLALAGARGLYPDNIFIISNAAYPNCAQANTRALNALSGNPVDSSILGPGDVTVQTGSWDYTTRTFTAGCNSLTNTVQVTTRRNDVNMFFARIFGVNSVNETASATAVMDWVKGVGNGTLPIAVNVDYAMSGHVEKITFNPSTSDVGGWFAVPPDSASASTLNDYVNNGSCPPIKVGDIINLNNGVINSVLSSLASKLSSHGGSWDTALPVVDSTQFNENKPVLGFLGFRINEVSAHGGDKYVKGIPLGLSMGPGSSIPGGTSYGMLAPPKLVN